MRIWMLGVVTEQRIVMIVWKSRDLLRKKVCFEVQTKLKYLFPCKPFRC